MGETEGTLPCCKDGDCCTQRRALNARTQINLMCGDEFEVSDSYDAVSRAITRARSDSFSRRIVEFTAPNGTRVAINTSSVSAVVEL